MINRYIDHTSLKPTVSVNDVVTLCEEAKEHKFFAVCVPPSFVKLASQQLAGSDVRVSTVVGFPFGYSTSNVKIFEASEAAIDGAVEIDLVVNIGDVKKNDANAIQNELMSVKKAIKGRVLKVIIETNLLTQEEKHFVCEVLNSVQPNYVKTSTGFNDSKAIVEDVVLLRSLLNSEIKIKASGKIDSYEKAKELIKAGAQRIGTSSGTKIYDEYLLSDIKKSSNDDTSSTYDLEKNENQQNDDLNLKEHDLSLMADEYQQASEDNHDTHHLSDDESHDVDSSDFKEDDQANHNNLENLNESEQEKDLDNDNLHKDEWIDYDEHHENLVDENESFDELGDFSASTKTAELDNDHSHDSLSDHENKVSSVGSSEDKNRN